jgi:hypothetical protein
MSVPHGSLMAVAQPLKEMIDDESVGVLADGVATAWSPFERRRFVSAATTGLTGLEIKYRDRHVSRALHETLPLTFPRAATILR